MNAIVSTTTTTTTTAAARTTSTTTKSRFGLADADVRIAGVVCHLLGVLGFVRSASETA